MKPLYLFRVLLPLFLLGTLAVQGEGTKEVMPNSANGTGLIVSTSTTFPLGNVGSFMPGTNPATGKTPIDQRIYFRVKDFTKESLYYGFNWETLAPSGTISTYTDVYMNVYAPGDVLVSTIHLPSSGAGFITTWTKAIFGTKLGGVGSGYDPLIFTPTMNGDYYVNFYRSSDGGVTHDIQESMLAKYFDMTVVSQVGAVYTKNIGRIHCNEWAFSVYNPASNDWQDPLGSTNAQFFTFTPDSVVAKVYFPTSGFQPLSYIVAFNSFGVINGGNWIQDRRSIVLTKLDTLHLRGGYDVFLNQPDTTMWKPSVLPLVPQLVNPTISGCAPGPYYIRFKAPQAGDYYMTLDLNGTTGYQANSADRFIELISQSPGIVTYVWDGKNGLGVPVPANATFPIQFSFRKGRINIPFYDVELNIKGLLVDGVAPQKSFNHTLYWDDTQIYTVTNDPLPNNNNTTTGGIDNSIVGQVSPGHAWSGDGNPGMAIPAPSVGSNATDNDQTNDYGNARLINTWAWGVVLDTIQNITLTCVSVSGTVWDDANNSAAGTFSNIFTTGENTTNAGNALYASLVDPISGNVISTTTVSTTFVAGVGTYTLTNCPANATDMKIVISTVAPVVGNPPPAPAIPSAWINTSPLTQTFNSGTGNVTGLDFGIEQLPNSNDQTYTIAVPVLNTYVTLNGFGTITSPGPLVGSDPEDGAMGSGKTVVITQIPSNEELYYNGVLVTNNTSIPNYNVALLKVKFISITVTQTSFQYAFVDAAGKQDPTPATYKINMGTVLATTIGAFTGRSADEGNVLNWNAFNESNGVYYIIERSADGRDFSPVGRVENGNVNHVFTDTHPITDVPNYYRLQLSDLSGGVSYSNIVTITPAPSSAVLEIAPNPFQDVINVRLNLLSPEKISLRLLDSKGMLLKKVEYQGVRGTNSLSMTSLPALPVSIYFIQIVLSDQTFVRKVFNR